MELTPETQSMIVVAIIAVVVFFAMRELFCWYWKINKTVALLERIANKIAPLAEEKAAVPDPFEAGKDAHMAQDYATALRLWQPLADSGDARAQYNIGIMHEQGQGVQQDYLEAYKWFSLAAAKDQGSEYAEKAAKSKEWVANRLSPERLVEAERRVATWKPA